MDKSLRWKSIFLTALVVLSLVYLIPSTGAKLPGGLSSIFSKRVQLGLDIAGGERIVYGVNLDKVVDDKAGEIKRDVEDRLRTEKKEGQVLAPAERPGEVHVAAEGVDVAKLLDAYQDVVRKIDCPQGQGPKLTYCVRVSSDYADKLKTSALEENIRIIRERVDKSGVREPTIIRKGDDIIVELPGVDEKARAELRQTIDRSAVLEFKMVDNGSTFMDQLAKHVNSDPKAQEAGITAEPDGWSHEEKGRFSDYYLATKDKPVEHMTKEEADKAKCVLQGKARADGKYPCKVLGRTVMESYLKSLPEELKVPGDHEIRFEKEERARKSEGASSAPETSWRSYYLFRTAELTGSMITSADVGWDPETNKPEVLVSFNRQGTDRFGRMTSANVGKKMAIVLDETVTSAPNIQSAILGGRTRITMGVADPREAQTEAKVLTNVLRTGSLQAPLIRQSESRVGAMLGQDSITRAKWSMVVGAILVVGLMLFFYKFSGMLANLAMVMNILFQIAILAAFQASLTLPGIAGLVLTIGMAVDSNIIIYERIREELRAGKSVRGAVDAGFGRAFWTVFDAHVTNFVAGFVLLEYGTGPIRGFAVMLLIGVVCNLFTSTWASRLLFDHYLRRQSSKTAAALSI